MTVMMAICGTMLCLCLTDLVSMSVTALLLCLKSYCAWVCGMAVHMTEVVCP